jgi:uncharacterized membrane protein YjjP (DUF1212 family)
MLLLYAHALLCRYLKKTFGGDVRTFFLSFFDSFAYLFFLFEKRTKSSFVARKKKKRNRNPSS